MRTKQQAFTHVVKSTWNQSRKQGYGEKRAPWHYFPWHYFALWSLYEIIHICTGVVDESEEWSSRSIFQFKQLERRSLKKSGLQRDSNSWPPRYLCDALPTELWSHTLGASSHLPVQWNDVTFIWNNSYLYCGCSWKWRVIIAVNFPI